eukprot:326941-Pelagomonas_calceolata.AAC.1
MSAYGFMGLVSKVALLRRSVSSCLAGGQQQEWTGPFLLIIVCLKFKDALEKSGPCSFDVFCFPDWLPGNAYKLFAERA